MRPKERVLRILFILIQQPYRFTRDGLANRFGCCKDTISDDLNAIKSTGVNIDTEAAPYYRLALLPQEGFRELKYLQSLTDVEKETISDALSKYLASGKESLALKNKLDSLYDFQKLGLRSLRRPNLDKIDALEKARHAQCQVELIQYRSNSNSIKNRKVEPFDIDPELDILQAYDLEKKETRHFKISRIERVELIHTHWVYKSHHQLKKADVFRIVNDRQVMVHLRLQIYAYNSLLEAYPMARNDTIASTIENQYDFETKVNDQFRGITNFIMANMSHLTIMNPPELKHHIIKHLKKLKENVEIIEG